MIKLKTIKTDKKTKEKTKKSKEVPNLNIYYYSKKQKL